MSRLASDHHPFQFEIRSPLFALLILILLNGCTKGFQVNGSDFWQNLSGSVQGTTAPGQLQINQVTPNAVSVQPGANFNLIFHWQGSYPNKEYAVFVNFIDNQGKVVFQANHAARPSTQTWSGAISYTQMIHVPQTLVTGKYQIAVGLYSQNANPTADPTQAVPLSLGSGVQQLFGNSYLVGELTVSGPPSTQASGSGSGAATTPQPVKAQSAFSFLDAIGVNTHLGAVGNPISGYNSVTKVSAEINYLGIKHIRDDLHIGANLSALQQVNQQTSAKFNLVSGYYGSDGGTTVITDAINNVQTAASIIGSIEGPNEPDWFGVYFDGLSGAPAVIAAQKFIYNSVKSNASLKNLPVYCTALSYPANGGMATQIGDLSAVCDFASLHAYPENHSLGGPFLIDDFLKLWGQFPAAVTAIGRPTVITEGNWSTASLLTEGIDESTQAKYLMTYLLDAFAQGISQIYLYELSDDNSDPNDTSTENHYGIFHFDNTPKPAADLLNHLHTALQGATPSKLESLNYSVDNLPAHGHQLLLQNADGSFILALWTEQVDWDSTAHAEISIPSTPVTLNLAVSASSVSMIDPLLSANAQAVYPNVAGPNVAGSLTLSLPDHPIFVKIQP